MKKCCVDSSNPAAFVISGFSFVNFSGISLRCGNSQGAMLAVGKPFRSPTSRPPSNTRVFSPASQSSFAAHPPLIPEPTTIASYVFKYFLFLILKRHGQLHVQ